MVIGSIPMIKDFFADDIEDGRIFVFGTFEFLQNFCKCKTTFMDGTFYISPEIYSQTY